MFVEGPNISSLCIVCVAYISHIQHYSKCFSRNSTKNKTKYNCYVQHTIYNKTFRPFLTSVVTDNCYPYMSGQNKEAEMKKYSCMLPGHSTAPCPNNQEYSDKYRTSPPYRISTKVDTENSFKLLVLLSGGLIPCNHGYLGPTLTLVLPRG